MWPEGLEPCNCDCGYLWQHEATGSRFRVYVASGAVVDRTLGVAIHHPALALPSNPEDVPSPILGFSSPEPFAEVEWSTVPDQAGVYALYDGEELLYVGMAGRDGKGSLRRRLKDHSSGQVVNMFAQYLFFARAQFLSTERVTHPSHAKALCQRYIRERCFVSWKTCASGAEARELEAKLKVSHHPALNGSTNSDA